jgi:hypothetical protein
MSQQWRAANEQLSDAHPRDVATLRVPIGRLCGARCAEGIELRPCANPNVLQAHVDPTHDVAHVEAQPLTVSIEKLAAIADEVCGERCPVPLPDPAVQSHHHSHVAKFAGG